MLTALVCLLLAADPPQPKKLDRPIYSPTVYEEWRTYSLMGKIDWSGGVGMVPLSQRNHFQRVPTWGVAGIKITAFDSAILNKLDSLSRTQQPIVVTGHAWHSSLASPGDQSPDAFIIVVTAIRRPEI